jgi:hypothetical protein
MDQEELGEKLIGEDGLIESGDRVLQIAGPLVFPVLAIERHEELLEGYPAAVGDAVFGRAEDFIEGVAGYSGNADHVGHAQPGATEFMKHLGYRVDDATAAMVVEIAP